MILTEEEARTKWCPHRGVPPSTSGGYITSNHDERVADTMCIASNCMMWHRLIGSDTDEGYCGLAGG